MQLIITIMTDNIQEDFQINSDMVIKEALKIIKENGHITLKTECQYVYSHRKDAMISTLYTFKEANIYTGDIIEVGRIG